MAKLMNQEERGRVALERLLELMADMGWTEDWAIEELHAEIGEPLGLGKKATEAWFLPDRRSIPAHMIFNVAVILGVDVAWLAGETTLTKAEAADGHRGLYHREFQREARRRAPPERKIRRANP